MHFLYQKVKAECHQPQLFPLPPSLVPNPSPPPIHCTMWGEWRHPHRSWHSLTLLSERSEPLFNPFLLPIAHLEVFMPPE
jgi:hypothetical protein